MPGLESRGSPYRVFTPTHQTTLPLRAPGWRAVLGEGTAFIHPGPSLSGDHPHIEAI